MEELKLRKVTLKNVLTPTDSKDLEVEVVPFNRRNDLHVTFAFDYCDMLGRNPSPYKTESDAARDYVRLFMKHTEEEMKNPESPISCVLSDLRACRILMFQPDTQAEFHSFFMND